MKAVAFLSFFSGLACAQELCSQFGYHAGFGYEFNNNVWGQRFGQGSQCTYVDKVAYGGVAWHSTWSWSGGEHNVKSYPYSGRQLPNKRIVNSIDKLPSTATWNYKGNNIRANVAYDLFTASDPNHPTSKGEYEVMIWLARIGGVYPIGQSVGIVTIENMPWELFIGQNGDMKVFTFIAPNQRNYYSGDVKNYFNYIRDRHGYPANNQYLLTYQFGTEPFTGNSGTFTCENFWAEACTSFNTMGLGTKIKEALSGDKDNHNARRRKTPGAYPDSTVDIPRTDTWQSSHQTSNKPAHDTRAESIAEEGEYSEYTHAPAGQNRHDAVSPLSDMNEEDRIPATHQRTASGRHEKLTKQPKQQYPYWGEFGKPNTNDTAAAEKNQRGYSDKDSGIDATRKSSDEHPINTKISEGYNNQAGIDADPYGQGNDLGRNNTVSSNTHPALRGAPNSGLADEHNQYGITTSGVNRGRAVLVDDEAAKAKSMAASQVSQPSQVPNASAPYENADQGYDGANYGYGNYGLAHGGADGIYDASPAVQRTGTVNSRGPANATQRFVDSPFGQREQPSPVVNSPNSTGDSPRKSLGDHYGPGHAGARVLHRCQHCGNDNDITKYFNRDVVYRLS
ncbi:endoglucanase [Paramyrothecium foliicola]|nr:endoglucanase [Paramyrothecium foliicola]